MAFGVWWGHYCNKEQNGDGNGQTECLHRDHDLLTWNCAHFASAETMKRFAEFCRRGSLWLPVLCTPYEMSGDEGDVEP